MTNPTIADNKPIKVSLTKDSEYYFCTCGQSKNQPFCDGSHAERVLNLKPLLLKKPAMLTFAAANIRLMRRIAMARISSLVRSRWARKARDLHLQALHLQHHLHPVHQNQKPLQKSRRWSLFINWRATVCLRSAITGQ